MTYKRDPNKIFLDHLIRGARQFGKSNTPKPPLGKEKDSVFDVTTSQLLYTLISCADPDGTNIFPSQEYLADKAFCNVRELRKRLKVLINLGYLVKECDETGKVRRVGKHVVYRLHLPGVHDRPGAAAPELQATSKVVGIESDPFDGELDGLDEAEPQKERIAPPLRMKPLKKQISDMTPEEYRERQEEVARHIIDNLAYGRTFKTFQALAQVWHINLDICQQIAEEQKRLNAISEHETVRLRIVEA